MRNIKLKILNVIFTLLAHCIMFTQVSSKNLLSCFNLHIYIALRIVGGGVQTGSTRHRGHLLAYCTCPGWLWGWRIIRWNDDCQGKPKYSEKTCPSATLSTTNTTWPDPGSNSGRRGGKPATNRLSYVAALHIIIYILYTIYIHRYPPRLRHNLFLRNRQKSIHICCSFHENILHALKLTKWRKTK
jgi:hypothetical protein